MSYGDFKTIDEVVDKFLTGLHGLNGLTGLTHLDHLICLHKHIV